MESRAFWRPLDRAELPFLEWVERVRLGGPVEQATELITRAGEHGVVWFAIGGVAAAVDHPRRSRWKRGLGVIGAVYAINTLLKLIARRGRPPIAARGTPTGLSFPSAHAATSFAAARLFSEIEPRAKLPLYVAATSVTGSRLHFCVHYPSDLIAGAALGDLIARLSR